MPDDIQTTRQIVNCQRIHCVSYFIWFRTIKYVKSTFTEMRWRFVFLALIYSSIMIQVQKERLATGIHLMECCCRRNCSRQGTASFGDRTFLKAWLSLLLPWEIMQERLHFSQSARRCIPGLPSNRLAWPLCSCQSVELNR